MEIENLLINMFPHFKHIVERICTPSWNLKDEFYDRHNIILIYDGEAVFNCNGIEYKGSRGDMIYFKPGDFRRARTFPENLMKCFAVDFIYTCPVINNEGWSLSYSELPFEFLERINDTSLFARVLDLFNSLTRIWISGSQNKTLKCRAVFMEIIDLLLMWKNGNSINYDRFRKVEKIIGFMTENYSKHLKLEDLCRTIQISPSYLIGIFKEVIGKSPIDYLIDIRLNKAKELLKDGHTVTEAAQNVGFSDVFYFSKCFKKREGISPSQL